MDKINTIIIGLGNIALGMDLSSHKLDCLTHVKALTLDDRYHLICGIDFNIKSCQIFSEYTGIHAYQDIKIAREKLSHTEIDLVVLATPNINRYEQINDIINHFRPNYILVEKPLCLSVEESVGIQDLLKSKNVEVIVNYIRRFSDNFKELKNDIEENRFGDLVACNVKYSNGLFNNASHFINLIQYLFNGELSIIWSSQKKMKILYKNDYNFDFCLGYKNILVHFQAISNASYSIGELDLVFKNDRMLFYDFGFKCQQWHEVADEIFSGYTKMEKYKDINFLERNYMSLVYNNIYDQIVKKSVNQNSIKSVIRTIEICERLVKE